jgi:fumarylacetoacetate (FAA) hydrolase
LVLAFRFKTELCEQMKLASYKDGSRDGQLVVVSRDLSMAHYATGTAHTLAQVLDDWNFISPQLQDLSVTLNQGKARHAFPFDPRMCMAPMPRARQWLHVPLGAEPLQSQKRPALVSGDASHLQGAHVALGLNPEAAELDLEGQWAVVCGDVAQGAKPTEALEGGRLIMLAADMVWRQLEAGGALPSLASRPATVFAPVAVTPDELGEAWQGGRVGLPLQVAINGRKLGLCDGADMPYGAGQLLAQACAGRPLASGAVVGMGPWLSPADAGTHNYPKGGTCVAHRRAIENASGGMPSTPWLQAADSLRLEAKGRDGQSVFGAIELLVGHALALPVALESSTTQAQML